MELVPSRLLPEAVFDGNGDTVGAGMDGKSGKVSASVLSSRSTWFGTDSESLVVEEVSLSGQCDTSKVFLPSHLSNMSLVQAAV